MMKICSFIILGLGVLFVSLLDCSNGQSGLLQHWSPWTELPCSKTCGGGRRRQTRVCIGGTTCPGLKHTETACNLNICPLRQNPLIGGGGLLGLQHQWSSWSDLPCSKTCGTGRKRQTRICIGGTNCPGLPTLETVCNVQPCPLFGLGVGEIGHLGQWSQWTELPCSAPCGGGRKRQTRICIGGLNCPGLPELETVCNVHLCPIGLGLGLGHQQSLLGGRNSLLNQPLHAWNQWAPWSICSAPCGGGQQQRSRVCIGGGVCLGQPTMHRPCNHHFC